MIFTDVDAEWNPDQHAVQWKGSGGANPYARNTIQYIAQQQYQKDYDSSTKKTTPSNLSDTFTRHQLNMYVEQYLENVCRHDPNMWIPCAAENGSCFCPMGTVRYGSADTKKWATNTLANTVSYKPKNQPCDGSKVFQSSFLGECPAHLPFRPSQKKQDGSYMCYKDINYKKHNGCPGGYTFGYETGLCTANWTPTCGESCWRKKCDDAKGYWNPNVYPEGYKDHLYTCYMPNLACHKSAQYTGRQEVTECSCDPYAHDTTVPDYVINNNPHDKAIVSDKAFAFQVFQMAQSGAATSLKGFGSEALVECTNHHFGGLATTHAKTCECKRTSCKDLATINAEFRKDYENAWLHWKSDCTVSYQDPFALGKNKKVPCCNGLKEELKVWDGDGRNYYKCMAKDIGCTVSYQDPFALDKNKKVPCCDGLKEELKVWDGDGRNYFKCMAKDDSF